MKKLPPDWIAKRMRLFATPLGCTTHHHEFFVASLSTSGSGRSDITVSIETSAMDSKFIKRSCKRGEALKFGVLFPDGRRVTFDGRPGKPSKKVLTWWGWSVSFEIVCSNLTYLDA